MVKVSTKIGMNFLKIPNLVQSTDNRHQWRPWLNLIAESECILFIELANVVYRRVQSKLIPSTTSLMEKPRILGHFLCLALPSGQESNRNVA